MPSDRNGATPPIPDDHGDDRRFDRDERLFEDLLFLVDHLHALDAHSDASAQADTSPGSPGAPHSKSDHDMITPEVPARIGRYEVLRTLGEGGFGVVSLARDTKLKHLVALKVPRAELLGSRSARQRFITEARAAAALDHAGIVHIFDSDTIGPISYIASAYVAGPTLAEWLAAHTRPVPFQEAARFVARIADALAHAHGRNVLHRDLKPANVLLHPIAQTNADTLDDYQPRIADFGLAKLMEVGEQDQTGTGLPIGSPPYMAPEQAAGRSREVGRHTDIYSLGAILYEVVTHRPAFRGESSLETLRLVLETEPLAPRALRHGLPRDLETIIFTCMAKKPEKRYRTAEALWEDLGRFLEGKPIHARPVPRWEHAVRWIRRRPLAASALGVAGLAMTGLVAVVLWSNAWLRGHNLELERQKSLLVESVREADRQRDLADRHNYAMQFQLASRAYDAGEHRRAQVLLREMKPTGNVKGLHEFAWRHFWWKARVSPRLVGDIDAGILGDAAFSPDGQFAAVSGTDNEVTVWDMGHAQQLFSVTAPENRQVSVLRFSPNGRHLAVLYRCPDSASPRNSYEILVWEIETGKLAATIPETNEWDDALLSFCDTGRSLAMLGFSSLETGEPRFSLWDIALDRAGSPPIVRHPLHVRDLTIRQQGMRFTVIGGKDSAPVVYETVLLQPEMERGYNRKSCSGR